MPDKFDLNIAPSYSPILFVTALRQESQTLIQNLPTETVFHENKSTIYKLDDKPAYLLELGIGIPRNFEILLQHVKKIQAKLMINFGICGALEQNIDLFQVFFIERVCQTEKPEILLAEERNSFNKITGRYPKSSLVTVEKPVVNPEQREKLLRISNSRLVDMEAYSLAEFAKKQQIPIIIIKVVSDYANEKSLEFTKQQKAIWQKKLRTALLDLLKNLI